MTIDRSKRCLVIGAGIAGLMAARALQEAGVQVTVLEKARGVGGRMATRRTGCAVYDHGAQFFTARDPRFSDLTAKLIEAGAAEEWCRGFAGPDREARDDGHARFRGTSGMTSVPKQLAHGLHILLNQRVLAIEARGAQWSARTETGEEFVSDALLLTAPVPQSLSMLDAGGASLLANARAALELIRYDPCIAVMVQPTVCTLPAPGGMQLTEGPVSWIGDNQRKGISPCPAVTIHAGAEFSTAHWGRDDRTVAAALLLATSRWLSEPLSEAVVHRWRFAKPSVCHPEPCLVQSAPAPFAFAGDAFGETRVEGAALSGLAAAGGILNMLGVG